MDIEELISEHPHVYHMAEAGSWQSVIANGLLSTSALLELYEISGEQRVAIERSHRPECITISHRDHGQAVIRDQKPMREQTLSDCLLDGLSPKDWYEILNSRVFFWARRERLLQLLKARAYRDQAHDVLMVDTRRLVERYENQITLCPYNSGSTMMSAVPRGHGTFCSIAEYNLTEWRKRRGRQNAIVEVAVLHSVPDILECVVRVDRMQGVEVLEVLHG